MRSRLLIVSRSELFSAGIKRLLADDPEIQLLGVTGDCARAAALAMQRSPLTIAVDIGIDVDDCVDLLGRLATLSGVRVLALVSEFHRPTAERVRRAGASSIVYRNGPLAEFRAAVLRGARDGAAPDAARPDVLALAEHLNRLERQVLRLVADGCDESAIQKRLRISRGECQRVQSRVSDVTGTSNIAHLTKIAVRAGLTRLNAAAGR
jgi:DNA-binding NarL/FixJ family response regulator